MTRKSKIVLAVCVGAPLLAFAVVGIKVQYEHWSWVRQTDKFTESLQKPFKEDTYGGKTPEETWGMFLDALAKDDVDLAVKYFFFYDRDKQLARIEEGKKLGRYESAKAFYKKGPLIKDEIYGSMGYYHISQYLEKEKYVEAYSINFQINKYTKLWKLTEI